MSSDQPVTTRASWTVWVPVGSSSSTPKVRLAWSSAERIAVSGSWGHSGGRPPSSSSLVIGAGCGREPAIQTLLGVRGRNVFQPDEAIVAGPVERGEEVGVIDLAGARLVSTRHVADLDVGDVGQV